MSDVTAMFWVDGRPATKGSWRVGRRGKLRPDNERERPWANAVGWAAKASGVRMATGPVSVSIELYFVKPRKPTHDFPARNDVDKLARSCLDALTGIAWVDDQQVTELRVSKHWAGERGIGAAFIIATAPTTRTP